MDLSGLTIAVAIGTLFAAVGIGVDSLLLNRHAAAFDELALRWWMFFEQLRIADIPRIAVGVYLKGKNKILGPGFTLSFVVRAIALSAVLTTVTVPGGRMLGLKLVLECYERTGVGGGQLPLSQIWAAGWGWVGSTNVLYLIGVNLTFDFVTILITIILLSKALERSDYFLLSMILVDIFACLLLFQNALFIADHFDSASILAVEGYWSVLPSLVQGFSLGCPAFHLLTSKILFVSTILLPTLIYLLMIVALFVLREGFKLFRIIAMYLLEKSVEDKKTVFAHVGVSLGLVVAGGKAVVEIGRALT